MSYFRRCVRMLVPHTWESLVQDPADEKGAPSLLARLPENPGRILEKLTRNGRIVVALYVATALLVIVLVGPFLGREIFPQVSSGQLLLRFRAPIGSRVEATERLSLDVLRSIEKASGPGNVTITLGYVGAPPPNYPINTIYLWTSGQHEAVLRVALNPEAHIRVDEFEDQLRKSLPPQFPGCQFSFEAADIVTQIMNFGAPTPVEINVSGPDLGASRAFAEKVRGELAQVHALRDLQYDEPLDYPSVDVNIDRERAGQLGGTAAIVGRSFLAATSSSRVRIPNSWADPKSGVGYQVQVQIPQSEMASIQDVERIPVTLGTASHPLLGDVAQVSYGNVVGEYHRLNGQRIVKLTANVSGQYVGRVSNQCA